MQPQNIDALIHRLRCRPAVLVADKDGRWKDQIQLVNQEAGQMMIDAANTIERLRQELRAWRGDFDIKP